MSASEYLMALGLCLFLLMSVGCSESVLRQYTSLGKWAHPADAPTVISGKPKADQAAFASSEEILSEADWKILESIAPRPIWERIDDARKALGADKKSASTTQPAIQPVVKAAPPKRKIPRDVPITELPDGRLRIYYALRHFGGTVADASYDGGTERRKISRKYVDLGPMVALVNSQLSDKGKCVALPSKNALVITCDADARDTVLQLLADVDRPRRQVEIDARIFEVSHNFDFQYGAKTVLEHLAGDNKQQLASTFSTPAFLKSLKTTGLGDAAFQGSTLRLLQIFGDSGIQIDATFQALADTGLIKIVASPRITVEAGQTGKMLAGQELPIQSARYSTDTIITEKTTYRPVGVQLYITPKTIGTDTVTLHVLTIVSRVAGFSHRVDMSDEEFAQTLVNPTFDTREAETHVTVPDGDTLVIGGLRMVRQITMERKVPGLGDLPILEWFFKNHRSQRELSDLYFFITPHIIPE